MSPDAAVILAAIEDLCDRPQEVATVLAIHWDHLRSWQRRINLTAIVDLEEAAQAHYRDSLEGARFVEGPCVDMGSGGGFPGIPLAVALPGEQFTLVEPRRKRSSFLRSAIAKMALDNVTVLEARSSDQPPMQFRTCVSRATFSSGDQLQDCLRWVEPAGKVVAWRSGDGVSRSGVDVHRYSIAGVARCLEINVNGA